ncbi:hypothetical protein BDQ12DRAFT_653955 [Crucibulum laeve]|uniref:Uncharacterized protein n=1 Tax=Crucibulum laeve TaxID=68775 RepID=A0A5C3LV07_9AGAR|nr:hypothetical protein BDQ12DRAFT_653955 [Crucibulum laeve]
MLPVANVHIRNLYDSALDFFAAYSPVSPSSTQAAPPTAPSTRPHTPEDSDSTIPLQREHSSSLRERLDAACQSPTSSIPPQSMRRELDNTKHQLARSQSDLTKLEERCRMLERTLRETRDLLRSRDNELERLRRERERERALAERRRSDVGPQQNQARERDAVQPRHSSLDIRSTAQSGMNGGALMNPNSNSSTTNGRQTPASQLSQSRSPTPSQSVDEVNARTRSAEIYLTRTDSWSGAQVLQAVHDINSEILQFAASATEVCTFSRANANSVSTSRSIQAMHDTSARIGTNMARIIANRDHSQDPILVQLALQGCLSLCIARALSAFCVGFPSKSDAVLAGIYSHIHLAEPQPTSSKWRALTHTHIHSMYPSLTDYSTTELADTILRWSSDIFLISGAAPDIASRDGLRARFGEQVRRIARAVCSLARVTREEIMSTNFEVVVADPQQPFDAAQGGGGMQDAFGEYGASRGAVLATTEIGLRCTKRMGGGPEGQGVTLEQRTLLQPKVVLESVLDVLDPR